MKEPTEHKTSDSETITYENIKRITIQKPIVKRDKRGGLNKLREMVFFLRDFGFKEKQEICYDDVEHAIMRVSQGTDPRTVKKHLNLLVKFGYLKPVGHPLAKNTQVTVRFNEKVSGKTYTSKKGNSSYVFGIMAPKEYFQPLLNVKSVPPVPPLPNEDERVSDMLDRVGVTSKKCVCANGEARENDDNVVVNGDSIREKKERKLSHTHISKSCLKHNINRKTHDTVDFGLLQPKARGESS